MARVVLSSDGWTQLTERICSPVFPQGLLQFCHSPVTQLENPNKERDTRLLRTFQIWKCWCKEWKRHTWVGGRASGCSLWCLLLVSCWICYRSSCGPFCCQPFFYSRNADTASLQWERRDSLNKMQAWNQKRRPSKMHPANVREPAVQTTSTAGLGAVGPFLWSPLVGTVLHQHVVLNGWVTVHVHHVLIRQIHILISMQFHL